MARDVNIGAPKVGGALTATVTASANSGAHDVELVNATSGEITRTLPQASASSGKVILFKKTDSSANAVVIAAAGSETVDGQASISLTAQYETVQLVSDGSNWHIM